MPFPNFSLYDEKTTYFYSEYAQSGIDAFIENLQIEDCIRIYIDRAPRYGNQASSINLVRRLVEPPDSPWSGFGYRGAVEVYYENDDVLNKIKALLPELASDNKGPYGNVKLLDLEKNKPIQQVKFGFTGACDRWGNPPQLNVAYFLILQPFLWNASPDGNVLVKYNDKGEKLFSKTFNDILKASNMSNANVNIRAYRLPVVPLTDAEWSYYQDEKIFSKEVIDAVKILRTIINGDYRAQISLGITYGINNPHQGYAFERPIEQRIVLAMAGLRSAELSKPPLLINFGDYNPNLDDGTNFQAIQGLLQGQYTLTESQQALNNHERIRQNRERRERSFTFPDMENTYRLINYLQNDKQVVDIQKHLTWLTEQGTQRVLFLQLRFVPPPVFAQLLAMVDLPAIFEGSNTAALALNIGKPYFNVTRVGINNNYPPEDLKSIYSASGPVKKIQTVANQIQKKLEEWPEKVEEAPNYIIGNFIKELHQPDNNYKKYFESIQAYYQNPLNDKFSVSLFSLCILDAYDNIPEARKEAPLDTLYLLLKQLADEKGYIAVLQDVFPDGNIHQFYAALIQSSQDELLITQSHVEAVYEEDVLARVILTGSTLSFGQLTDATLIFTAPFEIIVSDATFIATSTWSLDGIPWIVFERPFLQAVASDTPIPPSSTIGGHLQGTDIELRMTFPTANNRILVHGEFDKAKTISDFFALAGGIDLLRIIPEPLQTLSGLGVKYVEFVYNTVTVNIEYISLLIEADEVWQFFGQRLSLEDLQVLVSVTNPIVLDPKQANARQVSAAFQGTLRLGSELDAPRLEVSAQVPEVVLRGQLLEVALPLDTLLRVFWADASLPWPDGHVPAITELAFSYAMASNEFNLSLTLDLQRWPITIGGHEILAIVSFSLLLLVGGGNTFGSLSGSLILLPGKADIGLTLISTYTGNGWRFEAIQTSGKVSIADLLSTYLSWSCPFQLDIDGLDLIIETATNSFEFAGRAVGEWTPPIGDTHFTGELRTRIGYNGGSSTLGPDLVRVGRASIPVLTSQGDTVMLLAAGSDAKLRGWFGEVSVELNWNGIDLTLFYNFDPNYQKFGITWGILSGEIEEKIIEDRKHQIATLRFTGSTTLGSMVETMVSWLTGSRFSLAAPWSVLNSISLNRLALVYDFTDNKVFFEVALGPIELGFARIDGIALSYNSGSENPDENGVIVTLKGSFRWQTESEKPLSWDAARPETTQGPPGSGNKYLDLRMLTLGQHVTVEGLKDATSIQQAISYMEKLPIPKPGELPPVRFDATSSWLIGADFGILRLKEDENGEYFLTLQMVFNDPHLYGLRIALNGAPAKILAGLDFQILYRQVSETVGVYQAEITLPDMMRHLNIGAYSLTLPVFGIALYTNGDFLIDLGFPWNTNFARSFSVEALIFPGIPLLGSAGLYFGKLSSATTKLVPAATNGTFNPVLVFGFGAQVGFGKSLEYGVFKAGFSLTIVGILEGVIAKWNPYELTLPQATSDSQLQGEYYFWLRGTLGIVGKLYGTIDFSVVKAEVNVQILLLIQLTFESYAPMVLTVLASVDVSVNLQINLGLFKINLHFTFSLFVKETFTILSSGTAPWTVNSAPATGLLQAPIASRLLALQEALQPEARAVALVPNWSHLLPAIEPLQISGYLAPALTIAGDGATAPQQQQACAIAMLFLQSVPPVTQDTHTSQLKAWDILPDTSFELLCKQLLRWLVAAVQDHPLSAEEVNQSIVTDKQLCFLLDTLSSSDMPIPPIALEEFLRTQILLTIQVPPEQGEADATFFPMPLALELDIPDYGDWQGYRYTFAEYNALSSTFLAELRTYFQALAVQVGQESTVSSQGTNEEMSMASFVFSDYFLLLSRQLIQSARSALRSFTYPIEKGKTVRAIVSWVNNTGELENTFTAYDLFAANQTHLLTDARPMTIGRAYSVTDASESFSSIAHDTGSFFTPAALALTNAAHTALLQPGTKIRYPEQPEYTVQSGDTLLRIAQHFVVDLTDLLIQARLLDDKMVLQLDAELFLPYVTYQTQMEDTFTSITQLTLYNGAFTATELALQNAGRNILRTGVTISYPHRDAYTIMPGDCLGDVATHFGVSLLELLTNTELLLQPDILATMGTLALPRFIAHTSSGMTLQDVATRFGTTLTELAATTENAEIVDLFDAIPDPNLILPHLPQFRVAEVITEIQRSLGLQQLSGMASRYYLHGLRLPTSITPQQPGIIPRHRGMWVTEENGIMTLPDQAGLYALTGQQFPLPSIQNAPFIIHLNRPEALSWVIFGGKNPDRLTLTIAPDSSDNLRLQAIRAYATANHLDATLTRSTVKSSVTSDFATYPLTSSLIWQSANSILLPYGQPSSGVPSLRLWKLPDAMTELPDLNTHAIDPRFKLLIGRYDEATGATLNREVASYGWASTIEFTLKKLPLPETVALSPVHSALKTTYEIVGAGGNAIVLMERLLSQVRDDENAFTTLQLGYAPDQTSDTPQGIRTDALDAGIMGIAQVNLSTETNPPTALATDSVPGLLNTRSEFIRLLWEASITRSGGFYLYYYNADLGGGLPDRIFNDKGEAQVTLIVLYSKPEQKYAQNRLTNYMNAVATNEYIDAQAVVFAQADPIRPKEQIQARATDTLRNLAERHYGDPGELALDNANLLLAARTPIHISRGVYEVPPAGIAPGGKLADIATHFHTTIQAIKDINPHITSWPDPLPLFTSLRLPRLEVLEGVDPGGNTLRQLSTYYGEALSALAAENQDIPGLFAENQPVIVAGGPLVWSSTVPPAVAAVEMQRPIPANVPTDPKDPDYGRLFLHHIYHLLSYQISENADFMSSVLGLPAGPTTTSNALASSAKMRVPKILAEGDNWNYHQTLPYARFTKPTTTRKRHSSLLDPEQSPYRAIGMLLQLDFAWQDVYGNRLLTTLSNPRAEDAGQLNRAPLVMGYTDRLVGLNQWPAVSANWQVQPGLAGKLPQLELLLSFDDSPYQGLLAAVPGNATTLLAHFTRPLDVITASERTHYQLDKQISVQSARLLSDGQTVELLVSPFTMAESYTLSISGIKTSDGTTTFSGQASFSYADAPQSQSSTIQEQAERDRRVYMQLYYQLTDHHGTELALQTSLLKNEMVTLSDATHSALLLWINSLYTFLADRAQASMSAPTPNREHSVRSAIEYTQLNESQIFELRLAFLITRTGGIVADELATIPGFRQVSTPIAPLIRKTGEQSDTLGLTEFARQFQDALSEEGTYRLKVATGVDRMHLSASSSGGVIWAVRIGLKEGTGIFYTITNGGKPAIFAPQPISNKLESRSHIPIFDYRSRQGIDFTTPSRFLDFAGIDVDFWVRQFFHALDDLLTPTFTAAIQLVDFHLQRTYLKNLLRYKKALAKLASEWMIPIFAHETIDNTTMRELFEQQILLQLSNAYTTNAGIQFQARVEIHPSENQIAQQPARLFGTVIQNEIPSSLRINEGRKVTLTSPRLTLQTGNAQPLAFLLNAGEIVTDANGQVVPRLPLDLSYQGTFIEHQIGEVPGIEDYLASSWLSLVIPEIKGPLHAPLGAFPVPLVLRSYPTTPTMIDQFGEQASSLGEALDELTRWNYHFTYSLPFHYPQDKVYGEIHFNEHDVSTTSFLDAFGELAQFITIFPAVKKDLQEILATIDATTTDQDIFAGAATALQAFNTMVEHIILAAQTSGGLSLSTHTDTPVSKKSDSYVFTLQEGCIQRDGVAALLVTLHGIPPQGMAAPEVLIDPSIYQVHPIKCDGTNCNEEAIQGDFCFWYQHKETQQPLSASDGQAITDRQLLLRGIDLLAYQDANAVVSLKRNEELIAGKPSAEPFIYTTGRISFANPFHPTIDTGEQVIRIETLGTGTSPRLATRTFKQHLDVLFQTVLEKNTQLTLTFQAEIHYDYTIYKDLNPLPLAILMQLPRHVTIGGEGGDTLTHMIEDWQASIQKWGEIHSPRTENGVLWFDLIIMSELTRQPMPLLRLRRISLPLQYISPSLWPSKSRST